MARPSIKTRCGNRWTEAHFTNFVKNLLRAGTKKWGPMQQCISKARTKRGFYLCACCGEEVPATIPHPTTGKRTKNIIADHKDPVVPPEEGFTTWDKFIERLFCEEDNFQAVCYMCHSRKSAEERQIATERRRREKLDDSNL